jgi:anti-anti-sigma factor
MPLSLETRFSGNVYVIRCKGRMVAGEELTSLEKALDLGSHEFCRMVLDLGELDRLDSTGMGLLVRYIVKLRKRGGDLRFAAAAPFITTLFNLTMLSVIVEFYPTEEDAVASFAKKHPVVDFRQSQGTRVMVIDEVGDMCVFLTTILRQHGFAVSSAVCLRDARTLLDARNADYLVIGPNAPKLPFEEVLASLKTMAPQAVPLRLGADFKTLTALDATARLLEMFTQQEQSQVSSLT